MGWPAAVRCRHEKVQENCIDLVGRIADRGAEFVPAREWMRICFELLDMLKVSWDPLCCQGCSSRGVGCYGGAGSCSLRCC